MKPLPLLLILAIPAACRREPAAPVPAAGHFSVKVAEYVPDGTHRRLRLLVHAENTTTAPLAAAPPAIQLFAGDKPVPPFLAPGLEPGVIAPGQSAEVETHWWLSPGDTAAALTLVVNGARHSVALPPEK
jgi:hypothetical protein